MSSVVWCHRFLVGLEKGGNNDKTIHHDDQNENIDNDRCIENGGQNASHLVVIVIIIIIIIIITIITIIIIITTITITITITIIIIIIFIIIIIIIILPSLTVEMTGKLN